MLAKLEPLGLWCARLSFADIPEFEDESVVDCDANFVALSAAADLAAILAVKEA